MERTMRFEKIMLNGDEFRVCYYYQFERFYGGKWHDLRDSTYRKNRISILLHDGEKVRFPFSNFVYRVKYLASIELQEISNDLFSGMRDEYLYIRNCSKERYSHWAARCSELGLLELSMLNLRASLLAPSDSDSDSEDLRL